MKNRRTNKQLEIDILTITLKIHKEFPELSKFIKEIPLEQVGGEDAPNDNKKLEAYMNSLEEILLSYSKTHKSDDKQGMKELPGYKLHPTSDDIYVKGIKESSLQPEDTSKQKTPIQPQGLRNKKYFSEVMSSYDLDVPGSELDDKQERIGSEDEENNYYSLGGDNHSNLDEN